MLALWEQSPRSLGELADELALEPATLSPLVKRLEAQGLVTRPAGPPTSACSTALTDAGRALRERALDVPRQVMERVGTDAASLVALRDALAPFAGARVAAPPEAAASSRRRELAHPMRSLRRPRFAGGRTPAGAACRRPHLDLSGAHRPCRRARKHQRKAQRPGRPRPQSQERRPRHPARFARRLHRPVAAPESRASRSTRSSPRASAATSSR